MQTAPLIQSITPPKRSDTTTNIAEKWKQFKQIWDNYAIITNLTAQKKKYSVVDCGASINIITKTHFTGSHVTPHKQNAEDMERNGNETPRDYPLKSLELQNWKEALIEFVVVSDNLTPLIGTRTAQQMELIRDCAIIIRRGALKPEGGALS